MAKILVKRNRSTDRRELIFGLDTGSTTGAGKTGITSMTGYYTRNTTSVAPTATSFTTSVTVINSTNLPGVYHITVPSAAFSNTNGADTCVVYLTATGMAPVVLEYQLVGFDPDDDTRLGLTQIPASGTILTGGTGANQVSTTSGLVTIGTNNDKNGYSLSQSFPANFSNLAITASTGKVTVGTNDDKTGYSLATAPPTESSIADAVWNEPMAGHTTTDTYGNSVLRAYNNTNAYLKTTGAGAGHVGADVHEIQNDVITGAALADSAGQDIADQILGRNIAGGSSTGRLVKDALRFLRNRFTLVGDVLTVYAEDDTTIAWTAVVSTDAAALPITGNNPAGGGA
jgi:hypothetical protein